MCASEGKKKQASVAHRPRNSSGMLQHAQTPTAARSTTTRLRTGYFGTCATWPAGPSRAAGDAGPGERSQSNAIGTAIEQAAFGSSLLRLSVHITKSSSRPSGGVFATGAGLTCECAFLPLPEKVHCCHQHGLDASRTPPERLPIVLELNFLIPAVGRSSHKPLYSSATTPPPLLTLAG